MRRGVPERRRAGATGARKQESRAAPSSCRGPPLAASGGQWGAPVVPRVRCLWQTIDKQPSAVLYGPLFLPSKPRDWEGCEARVPVPRSLRRRLRRFEGAARRTRLKRADSLV